MNILGENAMESVTDEKEKPATEMTFLEELQDLFDFLHSLWGILAGATLFFPLPAAFLSLIPVEYRWQTDDYMRGFGYFKPTMVISITTILIIFTMCWLVSHRQRFRPRQRKIMQRRALRCFAVGIFSLILYLAAYEVVADVTNAREIFRGNPALIPYDLLLLVSYAGFFVSLTAAFMILGMVEYYGEKAKRTAV